MGLLSGIASIATSGKRRRARKRINQAQRDQAAVIQRQQNRAFIRNFREQQAMAVLSGFTGGQEGGSSAALGLTSSIRTQGRTAIADLGEQQRLSNIIGYNQGKLDKYQDIISLAGAVDVIGGSTPVQQFAGDLQASENKFAKNTGNFIQDFFGS